MTDSIVCLKKNDVAKTRQAGTAPATGKDYQLPHFPHHYSSNMVRQAGAAPATGKDYQLPR